jgi:hypothetical protein
VAPILGAMTIRPPESDVERVYASIRVSAHDVLIAARASDRCDLRHRQCDGVQACARARVENWAQGIAQAAESSSANTMTRGERARPKSGLGCAGRPHR